MDDNVCSSSRDRNKGGGEARRGAVDVGKHSKRGATPSFQGVAVSVVMMSKAQSSKIAVIMNT